MVGVPTSTTAPDDPRALLTLGQAAELLGLDADEVERRLEDGSLPGARIAGRWRLRREDLDHVPPPTDASD